ETIAMVEMGLQCGPKCFEPDDDSEEKVLWDVDGFPFNDERAGPSTIAVGAQIARPANVVADLKLAGETLALLVLTAVALARETRPLVILPALAHLLRHADRGLQHDDPCHQGGEQAECRHHLLDRSYQHVVSLTLGTFHVRHGGARRTPKGGPRPPAIRR